MAKLDKHSRINWNKNPTIIFDLFWNKLFTLWKKLKKLQLFLKNKLSSYIFSNQFRIGWVILFIQSLVWVKFFKAQKQLLKFSILPTDKRKSIKWFPSVFWKNWFFQKLLSIFTDLEKNCNNMQLLQTMDQTCECCIKPWYYMHCIILKISDKLPNL